MTKPLSQTLPEFDDELHIKTLWQMLLDGHKCITRDTGWALILTTYLDAYIFSIRWILVVTGVHCGGNFVVLKQNVYLLVPVSLSYCPARPAWRVDVGLKEPVILLTCLVPGTMVENSRLPCVRVRLLQHHTSLIPCQSVEIIIIDTTWFLDISFDI